MKNRIKNEWVTLVTKDGKEVNFVKLARIVYKGKNYEVMRPTQSVNRISVAEHVFSVSYSGGEESFLFETDSVICAEVMKIYKREYTKDKVIKTTKKAARKTAWIVKLLIAIAIILVGLIFAIGFIIALAGDKNMVTLIMTGIIGGICLVGGGALLIRTIKGRD